MTTITIDRAVVEQALEALEMCRLNGSQYLYGNERDLVFSSITALRAALAQEPAPMPSFPPVSQWQRGCPVCKAHGNATGYVCPRYDCPTKVTCGGAV